MEDEEFVLMQHPDGHVVGGGFSIQSSWLQHGMAPITTLNQEEPLKGGAAASSPFEHLVVPAGLFYLPVTNRTNKTASLSQYDLTHIPASDDLFDQLFGLMHGKDMSTTRPKQTRKSANASKTTARKHTRRHKK